MAAAEYITAQGPSPSYRVVIDSAFMGGMEIHTAQWTRVLAAAGHRVTLLQVGKDLLTAPLASSQVQVVHHPIDPNLGKRDEYNAWGRLLRQYPADITVHARNGFTVVVPIALKRHSRKVITIDHAISGDIGNFNPNWQRPGFLKTLLASWAIDHTLAVSEAVRRSAIEVWRVKPSKITTCHNWVDTDHHHPDDAMRSAHRQSHGLGPDVFTIGYMGRLSSDKRVVDLTRAFTLFIRQYDRPSRLVIAGKGAERPTIDRIIQEQHLQDQVTLIDWTDDPASWHRSFDVETNLMLREPFGLSAVETMACGGVLLAQSGGGVDEYVQHMTNGLLVDMPTPQAIADQLLIIAALPQEQRSAIRAAARHTAVSRFSPQVAMANLLEKLGSPQAAALARTHGLAPLASQPSPTHPQGSHAPDQH